MFRALKKSGYSGYLSCEASGGEDPAAVAKHEFSEMQRLLRRISQASRKGVLIAAAGEVESAKHLASARPAPR